MFVGWPWLTNNHKFDSGNFGNKSPFWFSNNPRFTWAISKFSKMYSGNLFQIALQTNWSVQTEHFCHLIYCFIVLVVLIWFIALLLLLPTLLLFKYKLNKIGIKSSLKSKHAILLFWAWRESFNFWFKKNRREKFQFWLVSCFECFSNFSWSRKILKYGRSQTKNYRSKEAAG